MYSRVCLQTSSEGMKFLKSFLLGKICTLVFCEHFDVQLFSRFSILISHCFLRTVRSPENRAPLLDMIFCSFNVDNVIIDSNKVTTKEVSNLLVSITL